MPIDGTMLRLFIRIYLGVLVILFLASSIQSYINRGPSQEESTQIVEEAFGGGARVTREAYEKAVAEAGPLALADLNAKFDYPLSIVSFDELSAGALARIDAGDDVLYYPKNGQIHFLAPLTAGGEALLFGPLRGLEGPSQLENLSGLGGILLVAAAAIALLLRPVATQLHLVERTAAEIAGGRLSARVNERKVKSVAALAHAFNSMADRVESVLQSQRELLQAVSHELRTPLTRICFAIDLIRDAKTEEERGQWLDSLDNAAGEFDDLVGELLQYVRMSTSEQPVEREDIELLPLVEEVIERQAILHPQAQFELGDELRRGEFTLPADRTLLLRVLRNLLANAGRFASSRVIVNAHRTPEGIQLVVDDDGPGIPEADRHRVFDPFVSSGDPGSGSGLGLALVQRIVTRHGGEVTALPSPLGGARLQIQWPLVIPA